MEEQARGEEPPQQLRDETYHLNMDGGIVAAVYQSEGEAAIGVLITSEDREVTIARASARLGWCKDHHVAENVAAGG